MFCQTKGGRLQLASTLAITVTVRVVFTGWPTVVFCQTKGGRLQLASTLAITVTVRVVFTGWPTVVFCQTKRGLPALPVCCVAKLLVRDKRVQAKTSIICVNVQLHFTLKLKDSST